MLEDEIIIIEEDESGSRLDIYLTERYEELSRSFVSGRIKSGNIRVNDKKVKSGYILRSGDSIQIDAVDLTPPEILPEDIPLDILYEDEDVAVVNKPKGMVVHPAPGHYSGTLVNALMYHMGDRLSGINGVARPGIVHRIDMDTSGALLICKNDTAHNKIAEQIASHSVNRLYRGIIIGHTKEEAGTCDKPIGRHPNDRKKMSTNSRKPRNAVTHFRTLESFDGYSYMEFKLETGRTHQIRVHMSDIGHPLLGDEVYGTPDKKFKLQGQTLHAMTIGFVHPTTNEYMEFSAPLPDYFENLLKRLRG